MKTTLADTAGFCMGVGLALQKLDSLIVSGPKGKGPIRTMGPIIHNPQVLKDYADKGVERTDDPVDIAPGSTVVIRAHGIPRHVEQTLTDMGVHVVDATCPKVKKAQILIARQSEHGRRLLLFGEENHPEVRGLLSYAEHGADVFDSVKDLRAYLRPGIPYFLAAQTTQDRAVFEQIKEMLIDEGYDDVPVLETICDATKIRQNEAIAVARKVDKMVVAGGFSSGNTRRLVKVVKAQGIPCVHVETADQLNPEDFRGYEHVGLTAGASTPDKIIHQILERLKSF